MSRPGPKRLSRNLERLRESRGLTREEVALQTGISLGRIETIENTHITFDTLIALCDFYGYTDIYKMLKIEEIRFGFEPLLT